MYRSKKFQMYDYGTAAKNREHYGQVGEKITCIFKTREFICPHEKSHLCCLSLQATPPLYDATAMHVPVALYWAQNDWLADPTDVRMLLKLLPNQLYNKYIPHWDHLDFIWGLDAATVVYDDVIAHIRGEQ